jgi:ubiquinone/menaquinone biosynthesis C-methylase UbiE
MMGMKRESKHREAVAGYFDQEKNYPSDNAVIAVRTDALRFFSEGLFFENVLDVACGDGAVPLGITDRFRLLSLMDISEKMLERAKARTPEEMKERITFHRGDMLEAPLPPASFDLIICTGLLAHIRETEDYIRRMASLLRPGGYLFLQSTHSRHPYSLVVRLYRKLLSGLRKESYPLTQIPRKRLEGYLQKNGLRLEKSYASVVSFLFFSKLMKEGGKKSTIYRIFGSPSRPRRQSLGQDKLYWLKKESQ